MDTTVTIALCVTLIIVLAMFGALGMVVTYAYFRGMSRSSPLPQRIETLLNPPPKPETIPDPEQPKFPCPTCKQEEFTGWKLSKSWEKWACRACGREIPGPKKRVQA